MDKPITYTKNNGEIVDQQYARRRIMGCRDMRYLPNDTTLEMRQKIADRLVNQRWYNGVLVAYLCRQVFETYLDIKVEEAMAKEQPNDHA